MASSAGGESLSLLTLAVVQSTIANVVVGWYILLRVGGMDLCSGLSYDFGRSCWREKDDVEEVDIDLILSERWIGGLLYASASHALSLSLSLSLSLCVCMSPSLPTSTVQERRLLSRLSKRGKAIP